MCNSRTNIYNGYDGRVFANCQDFSCRFDDEVDTSKGIYEQIAELNLKHKDMPVLSESKVLITEPTVEQCMNRDVVDGRMAFWFPQLGGYVGKAVVEIITVDEDTCVDVYVWHDGDFSFQGVDSLTGETRNPAELHICNPDDFVYFGEFLNNFTNQSATEES